MLAARNSTAFWSFPDKNNGVIVSSVRLTLFIYLSMSGIYEMWPKPSLASRTLNHSFRSAKIASRWDLVLAVLIISNLVVAFPSLNPPSIWLTSPLLEARK
jgi:hypothetical protein